MTKSLEFLNNMDKMVEKLEKRRPGRPVVKDSKRQLDMIAKAERTAANGGTPRRGRPVVEGSNRQQKLAERKAKIEAGIEIKRGRPKVKNIMDVMNELDNMECFVKPIMEAVK